MLLSTALLHAAEPFHCDVYRVKPLRDEPGEIAFSESGVTYRSESGKTILNIPFSDIREADVSDPKRIRLETYDRTKWRIGGQRAVSFRLQEETHDRVLAHFLAEHLKRPVVGAYAVENENGFEIPAYHRELLGGSHGTLIIGSEAIRFLSKNPKYSRTWLYRDIETIGSASPFQFRLSTPAETYTFDLKEQLPERAYRLAWEHVYQLAPIRAER